jgi:hypothetical protein
VLGQRNQAIALERQNQVGQYVAGKLRRQGTRCVTCLPIRHERTATGERSAKERALGVVVGDHAAFGDCKNRRLTSLEFLGFVNRIGDYHTLPGVCERLGESLEQGGVSAGEKDHGLSLGRRKDSVKGWAR